MGITERKTNEIKDEAFYLVAICFSVDELTECILRISEILQEHGFSTFESEIKVKDHSILLKGKWIKAAGINIGKNGIPEYIKNQR